MNFELTEEQKMTQGMARDFAGNEFPPLIKKYERPGLTNDEYRELFNALLPKFKNVGFLGVTVPEKYGGQGCDTLSSLLIMEELAKVWGSGSLMFAVLNSLTTTPLLAFGDEEQKNQYLRNVATGKKIGCYGLTEPNAGSDASGLETSAQNFPGRPPLGSHWLLNGSKVFITHASLADFAIIFAKDSQTKKPSAFIVNTLRKGFRIGKIEHKAGLWASPTAEIIMEDCFVSDGQLLGELGKGMKVALTTLDTGRLYIAAQAIGLAQGAWNWTMNYTRQRKQFGKKIAEFQNTYMNLARFATKIEAARLLLYKAAALKDRGGQFTKEAAMAKFFATEVAVRIIGDLELLCGGIGYTEETPLPMYRRDADATRIYEGANAIQLFVIARSLGLTDKI